MSAFEFVDPELRDVLAQRLPPLTPECGAAIRMRRRIASPADVTQQVDVASARCSRCLMLLQPNISTFSFLNETWLLRALWSCGRRRRRRPCAAANPQGIHARTGHSRSPIEAAHSFVLPKLMPSTGVVPKTN